MPRKADFPKKTTETLRKRAGERCSNPKCQKTTSAPSSDKEKSLSSGRASHIKAAQPGGSRYDKNQTEEERKSIENAIWVCANCSDLIDKDPEKYTVEVLLQWKRDHEKQLLEEFSSSGDKSISRQTNDYIAELDQIKDFIENFKVFTALNLIVNFEKAHWVNASDIARYRFLTYKGRCWQWLDNTKEAAVHYIRAEKYNPQEENALAHLSFAYVLLNQFTKAEESVKIVLRKNPYHKFAISILMLIKAKHQSLKEVIDDVVPLECREKPIILFMLGYIAELKGSVDESRIWYEKAVLEDNFNNPFWVATLAATILFQEGRIEIIVKKPILSDNSRANLLKVIKLYSLAWDKITEQEFRKEKIEWILNRGYANFLLDNAEEALNDLRIVSELDPDNQIIIRNKAGYYAEMGKIDQAIEILENIKTNNGVEDASILFAELLAQKKDFTKAINILETFLLETVSKESEIEAKRLLVRIYAIDQQFKLAEQLNEEMIKEEPSNLLFLIDKSLILLNMDKKDDVLSVLNEIKSSITNDTPVRILIELARAFLEIRNFSDASLIFSKIKSINSHKPLMLDYISSTYHSGNINRTLRLCDQYSSRFGQNKDVVRVQISMLSEIGDIAKAEEKSIGFLNEFPEDLEVALDLAILYFRSGKKDKFIEILNRFKNLDSLNSNIIIEYVKLLFATSQCQKALKTLYEIVKDNFNDPGMQMTYFNLFISNQNRCEKALNPQAMVQIDTAIKLVNKQNTSIWYVIVDDDNIDVRLNERKKTNNISKKLLGKTISEEITFEDDFRSEAWRIEEIITKYVYLFREIGEKHSKWFPDSQGIKKIPISSISKFLDRQEKVSNKINKYYSQGRLLIGTISNIFEINIIDVWKQIIINPHLRLITCSSNITEYHQIRDYLNHNQPGIVLDLTAFLTLFIIQAEELLISISNDLFISQSTVDQIRFYIEELKSRKSSLVMISTISDNKITIKPGTPETIRKEVQFFEDLIDFIEKNCKILPCYEKLTLSREERKEKEKILHRAFFDTLMISKNPNLVLYSDELKIRELAKQSYSTESICTQHLLLYSLGRNIISRTLYNEFLVKLAFLQYSFLFITADTLVESLNLSKWKSEEYYIATLRFLSKENITEKKAIQISAQFIYSLSKTAFTTEEKINYIEKLLNILIQGRDKENVKYSLIQELFPLPTLKDENNVFHEIFKEFLPFIENWEV